MIEFLGDNYRFALMYWESGKPPLTEYLKYRIPDEICDVLWQAVKNKLKNN